MQRQWKIRTALDHAVDFNERVNAFTTGRACTLSSDIKHWHTAEMRVWASFLHCILCNTIKRRDSDSSWRWEELMLSLIWIWRWWIQSLWQPHAAMVTWVVAGQSSDHPCSSGHRLGIFSGIPSNATVCIRWVLDSQSGGGRFYWIEQSHPHHAIQWCWGVKR